MEIGYSQYGQDKKIFNFLKKEEGEKGFFIDIGAHDGVTYSNSNAFEKHFNWNGICIEPHPIVFEKLKENRNCILENCAISNIEGELEFIAASGYAEMLSGFNREDVIKDSLKNQKGSYEKIKVNTYRLDTILNRYDVSTADFCSIDVEGNEMNVIKSLNWDNYRIKYLCIEANKEIEDIINYLSPWYIKECGLGGDVILKRL